MNIKLLFTLPLFIVAILLSSFSYAETVWVDVRSAVEHSLDNIEGDVRIAHSEVVEGISKLHPNRTTEIRLYCRSGGRANKAMQALKAAGYTHVSNAGGINDARKERGIML